MTVSGGHQRSAPGDSPVTEVSVRSGELSSSLCSIVVLMSNAASKTPERLALPDVLKILDSCTVETEHYAAGAKTEDQEKRRKIDVPGLDGESIDGNEPIDVLVSNCQYPEQIEIYRAHARYRSMFMVWSSNAHATARDLSFVSLMPVLHVSTLRQAYDRCIFYYPEETERAYQWNIGLQLIRAGAERDAPEYRLLASTITDMYIPPFEGMHTRPSRAHKLIRHQAIFLECLSIALECCPAALECRSIALECSSVECRSVALEGMNTRTSRPTELIKYQTIWTDQVWNEDEKMQLILQGTLPEGFSNSTYYTSSRNALVELTNQ